MPDLITTFHALDERWPGFLRFLRAASGQPERIRYPDLMRLDAQMIADPEGVQLFLGAVMRAMTDRLSPEEAEFFAHHGLVSRELSALRERLDGLLLSASAVNITPAERAELKAELTVLRRTLRRLQAQSSAAFSQGVARLKTLSAGAPELA